MATKYQTIAEYTQSHNGTGVEIIEPEKGFRTWFCNIVFMDAKFTRHMVKGFGLDAQSAYENAQYHYEDYASTYGVASY